ncbi:MAG TPA: ABC transporter ATP-binding protein, partial [Isosphaeraceae bacterium]
MGSVHRIASRLRFAEYRRSRRAARRVAAPEPAGAGAQPPRSLARLLRALFGLLRGYRATLAGALGLLTVATALNLIPPAATKLVIDDVLLARRTASPAPPWLPPPGEPRARLVALAVGVLVISILGSLIGLGGRYWATRTTKRVQVAIRRRVFEHAVRLPLHRVYHLKSGGAASLLREDAGGVGELVFSLLYNPWRAVVQ